MTLLPPVTTSPLDEVYVALDLETTGLDPERDDIIEVGAVRFRGTDILETFDTLVNPKRTLSPFITELTGITQGQVDAAPPLAAVAGQLLAFLGPEPVVGHNVYFDMAFLAKAGIGLTNPRYDTLELASVFIPRAREYSLRGLVRAMGISHERPHRALDDAQACQELFVALIRRALDADPGLLAALGVIAGRSEWSLRSLLRQLGESAAGKRGGRKATSALGVLGLDMDSLKSRLARPRPMRPGHEMEKIDPHGVTDLLAENGALSRAFPGYEYRPQQAQMAQAVTEALNQEHHLFVEAGTGVGKSVAYLLPAMIFAVRNGRRVVVSTNTINLQEQLVSKDIPDLIQALQGESDGSLEGLQFAHLKGRANYLCFRRWAQMAPGGNLSAGDARMISKTLVWLQDTATGDRAEINIPGYDGYLWDRLSALGAGGCEARDEVCFLRTARARAEGAHVVVVNHALLLSDLATGGSVIPPYDYLIVDEAHHLEEEASRQFGYEVSWQDVEELSSRLAQRIQEVRTAVRSAALEAQVKERVERFTGEAEAGIPGFRESWARLTAAVSRFVEHHRERDGRWVQLRVTRSTRKQPDWSDLEVQWEGFNETLLGLARQVDKLLLALEPVELATLRDPVLELGTWQERTNEVRGHIESFVVQPDDEYVYWVTLSSREGMPVFSASPLNVAPKLKEELFSQKKCVVLTSATLSVDRSMGYLAERLGFTDPEELLVGSPFDFQNAALLLVPSDMPEPSDGSYQQAMEEATLQVARASDGGVLVLFTSHAAVQATRRGIKTVLDAEGIPILAQGVDGSPRQLLDSATANKKTVLLGTNSLWEGVDLPGDLLRVVVVARLPFNVPTDPLFAARSEQFTDPFTQYAVPQAVLRFRQGFGRLIRSKSDRGVVVVLDRRVLSKGYGKTFIRSLPPCTMRQGSIRGLGVEIRAWLQGPT